MQLPPVTMADIEAAILNKKRNRMDAFFPDTGPLRRELYKKHMEFISLTRTHKEVAFIAGNRTGKSETVVFAIACFLTGKYPHWWTGKRFDKPVNILVAGETATLVRDSIQKKLCGPINQLGTGMIPFDNFVSYRPKHGIPDAIDTVVVRHTPSGQDSTLQFRSYDQGREAFQATERDVIVLDEEPPMDVYTECLLRTMTTQGSILAAFTPLRGMTELILYFMPEIGSDTPHASPSRAYVTCTWDEAPHLTEDEKQKIYESIPPHQRDARTKGIPQLGAGAVYPVPESEIICDPFEIPVYWRRAYGMDVGWNRTCGIWGALDEKSDILYLYSEHYQGQEQPNVQAAAIRARGVELNGVIDPAARGRGQRDGEQLMQNYIDLGLKISVADNGVEAGVFNVYQRLSTGRLKVFRTLQNWLKEYRVYRRDDKGKIVKLNDHAMDATRYLVQSGIDVMDFPKEYLQSLQNRTAHQYQYNPLDKHHIHQDQTGATHQIDYHPLRR